MLHILQLLEGIEGGISSADVDCCHRLPETENLAKPLIVKKQDLYLRTANCCVESETRRFDKIAWGAL